MDAQTLPLVPFGKYKGQPITTLLNDTKYLEWCKQQEWFQKFPIVYNICVNQTITTNNQNSKTPEHNKLQNLFLERNFNITFINYLFRFDKSIILLNRLYDNEEYKFYFGNQKFNTIDYGLEKSLITPVFETIFNWDVRLLCGKYETIGMRSNDNNIELDSKYYNEKMVIYKKLFSNIKYVNYLYGGQECHYSFADIDVSIYIEIKPHMGDDYPNVLRKMNTQKNLTNDIDGIYILLIGEYASQHTTKEQIIQIFKQSKIRIVFMCELFNNLPSQIITEQIEKTQEEMQDITIYPIPQQEIEEENKLLREKLLQAEEKIKQLEEEIQTLKSSNKTKNIKDYFGKK